MEDDADLVHTSLDVNLKYGLDALVAKIFGNSTRYFSPFVYLGGGYTALRWRRRRSIKLWFWF